MLTPRNPNLGPEDPGFAKWCADVLGAAVTVWGALVLGLDYGRSGTVPELVVGENRSLLNQLGYADYQKGRPILDFLRAGLPAPPPPAPAPLPPPIIYKLNEAIQDLDGLWYEWRPWPFQGSGAPFKVRVPAPPSPPPAPPASDAAVQADREDTSLYILGRLTAVVQPQVVVAEFTTFLVWLANRPK
jgi:hypothetical protein